MDTTQAKKRLEEELHIVEQALSELGPRNPTTGEWEASAGDIDTTATEADELADRMEETEERQDELATFAGRRAEILAAIGRVDAGTYGTCTVCGDTIEEERLAINPASNTCSLHL